MNTFKATVKYHDYHQWAVFDGKYNVVIASFNTEKEAIDYANELNKELLAA